MQSPGIILALCTTTARGIHLISKAIKAYEKGAELGDGMALTNLGDLYYFGEHVKQDYDKALDFYQKAEKVLL